MNLVGFSEIGFNAKLACHIQIIEQLMVPLVVHWTKQQIVNSTNIKQDITSLSQITLNNGTFITSILDLKMLTASKAGLYMCGVTIVDKYVQGTSRLNLTIKSKLEN